MEWISLTDKQVEIEIDPEYDQPTGVVRFNGEQPVVIDTVDGTFSNFASDEDEAFDSMVYDDGVAVSEAAWYFGCRYVYVTDDVEYYWK